MAKWFDKWFSKKCKQAWEESNKIAKESSNEIAVSSKSINSNGMNFSVYRASGGHIIETRKYDRKKDHHDHNLHIITDDKDLGEEIGKIITFENLRA